jgi:hypothetical protein
MKKVSLILWIFICLLSNGLLAQNAPITTAGTSSTVGSTITISITAANFSNISSCNLKLHFDSTIARATATATGPLLGGSLNSDLSVPGKISLGWYAFPGVTLAGNPVLFNITFTKVATGTTAITWYDDGYSCVFYDGNFNPLNDLPTSTYYINGALTFLPPVAPVITVPTLFGCVGVNIDVPVSVAGFNDVGKFNLTMQYGTSAIAYQSFTSDAGFPGLTVDWSTPGTIVASGMVSGVLSGITLPDSAILFTLHFTFYGGSTGLMWSDNGASCEFAGPPPEYIALTDVPQQVHYVDGSVSQLLLPAAAGVIAGPSGGYVYRGQTGVTFQTAPIPDATGYIWSIPAGISITGGENTNKITVSIGNTFKNGYLTVKGYNMCGNGCGSPLFQLTDTTSFGIPIPDAGTNGDEPRLLLKSFPNPFSGRATLTWFLPVQGQVLLEIMNMSGEKVATLVDNFEQAGNHSFQVSSCGLRPGIYNARLLLKVNNKLIFNTIKIVCND